MTAKDTQQLGYFSFADDYSLMPFVVYSMSIYMPAECGRCLFDMF